VTAPVRAVVVEDSLLQRTALVRVLEADGTIRVVGQAASADEAVRIIARDAPDGVTMDLEMPGGTPDAPGGLLAIERVMATRAVPILVLSAHVAARGDTLAIDALAAGAVDVFPKDPGWPPEVAAALRRRLAVLSRLQMVTRRRRDAAPRVPRGDGVPVVGLAASTGGPSALRAIIPALAAVAAPILVVQHIHPAFAATFAEWLEHATGVPAVLAEDGMLPRPGTVHVAPPNVHLRLAPTRLLALDPEPALIARPSCDELLRSLAVIAGRRAVGAVLTGMGDDGARGLLEIHRHGGTTFAQDAATSIVDGMPRAARESGGAGAVLPLADLGHAIAEAVRRVAP
jgi:two-component system chemotaxis response regulator CheB